MNRAAVCVLALPLLGGAGALAQPLLLAPSRDTLERNRVSLEVELSTEGADEFVDRMNQSQRFPATLRLSDVLLFASWSPVSHLALAAQGGFRWSQYAPDPAEPAITENGVSGAGVLLFWSPSAAASALPLTFRAGYLTAPVESGEFLTVRDGIDRLQFGVHLESSRTAPSRWRGLFDASADSGFEERGRPRFYAVWSRVELGPCFGTVLDGELSLRAAAGVHLSSGAPLEGLLFNREQARAGFVGPVVRLDGVSGWTAAVSSTFDVFAVHNSLKGWRVAASLRRVL